MIHENKRANHSFKPEGKIRRTPIPGPMEVFRASITISSITILLFNFINEAFLLKDDNKFDANVAVYDLPQLFY
jgi:hypothetical protein